MDNLLTRRDLVDLALSAVLLFDIYQPRFFSSGDFNALQAFTEILIPTDEFPGAREAKCAEFIDFLVSASGEVPGVQDAWRNALQSLKAAGFHDADAAQRLHLVSEMSKPERDGAAQHPAFAAYRLIKRQTAFAFFTSKAGQIQTLDYKGNTYYAEFPACNHPEHQQV